MEIFDFTTENIVTHVIIDGPNAAATKIVENYGMGDDIADFMDEFTNKRWSEVAEQIRAMSDKEKIQSLFKEYLQWAFRHEINCGAIIIIEQVNF